MRAIIIKSCYECPYHEDGSKGFICMKMGLAQTEKMDELFPEWCPLRPLPKKLKLRIQREWITDYDRYEIGYNACLDKILGETE